MGPRYGLDAMEEGKISRLFQQSNLNSLDVLSYPGSQLREGKVAINGVPLCKKSTDIKLFHQQKEAEIVVIMCKIFISQGRNIYKTIQK